MGLCVCGANVVWDKLKSQSADSNTHAVTQIQVESIADHNKVTQNQFIPALIQNWSKAKVKPPNFT